MTNEELIAKIKAEIENLKSIEYPCDNSQQATGFCDALDRMTDYLSTLESEKPTNQKGLEEEIERCVIEPYYDLNGVAVKGATAYITVNDVADIARHFAEWGYLRAAEKYNEIEYNRQRAEESVPNDLEEAARHSEILTYPMPEDGDIEKVFKVQEARVFHEIGFIAGAKWQKEHSFTHHETNESLEEAVTHQMEDDGDVDDFIRKRLDKTVLKYAQIGAEWQKQHDAELIEIAYNDGITIGMTKQKEQMMKEAEECELYWDGGGYFLNIDLNMVALGYSEKDKVRVIIVKED